MNAKVMSVDRATGALEALDVRVAAPGATDRWERWWRRAFRPRWVHPAPAGSWALSRDATVPLRAGEGGVALTCRKGTFLVTQEGDPSDHVLEVGDRFQTRSPGLVVVWCLHEGTLGYEFPAAARDSRRVGR